VTLRIGVTLSLVGDFFVFIQGKNSPKKKAPTKPAVRLLKSINVLGALIGRLWYNQQQFQLSASTGGIK
jgi:hypothetical protein